MMFSVNKMAAVGYIEERDMIAVQTDSSRAGERGTAVVAVVVVIADTPMTGETVAVTPLEETHQKDRMLGGVAATLTVDGIDNSNNKMK